MRPPRTFLSLIATFCNYGGASARRWLFVSLLLLSVCVVLLLTTHSSSYFSFSLSLSPLSRTRGSLN